MRILIFGAGGNVGSRVASEATQRGHKVTAVFRDMSRVQSELPAEELRSGNAADPQNVAELSTGHDIVISATRPAPGKEDELVNMAKALLEGVRSSGVRLLLVGGAGSLLAPDTGQMIVDDERYVQPPWRDIAVACCKQYEACLTETRANWTYLSPPAQLAPGTRTGHYRKGRDVLLVDANGKSEISMEDLAVALIDEAEQVNSQRSRFTVAY